MMAWRLGLVLLLFGTVPGTGASRALGAVGSAGPGPLVQVLVSPGQAGYEEALRGFRHRLKEQLGPEGERYRLNVQVLESDKPALVELPELDEVRLIFSLGTPATLAARRLAGKRPVVFSMIADPVADGIYEPGRRLRLTGVTSELSLEDQLEALTQVLPRARRIGVLHHTLDTVILERVREDAEERELELVSVAVDSNDQVLGALEQLNSHIDVLWTFGRLLRRSPSLAQFLILHSLRNQLPLMGLSPDQVERGALFCAYATPDDIGRQSADVVQDLLSGKNVSELPPQTPQVTRIALNLRAADAIGQAIPREIRRLAAPVF
jgi:putative ABC transport system substrate-binding protein